MDLKEIGKWIDDLFYAVDKYECLAARKWAAWAPTRPAVPLLRARRMHERRRV